MRLARTIVAALAMTALAGSFGVASAQTPAQAPDTAPSPPPSGLAVGESTSGAYVLGRDDVVSIGLLGRNDFGGRVRVQADGSIQLPLVGKIVAADHTAAELSDTIRKALQTGGYYADPIVQVEVVSYASRYVVVLGNVRQPGLVPINRPYRMSEIMARVGGVHEGAADYIIVRSADGAEKRYNIRDLATGDSAKDPYVNPGDKIYAPNADLFYVTGQVRGAGVFPLTGEMTVGMAIAKAGGLTDSGSDKKVQVTRGGKTITLDTSAKIQAGDVLFVKERLF